MSRRIMMTLLSALALLSPFALYAQEARRPSAENSRPNALDKNRGAEISRLTVSRDDGSPGPSKPVFPPNPEAERARQRLLASFAGNRLPHSDGHRSPNILLILVDDIGYGDTGIYGSEAIPTPHIDDLAKKGARWSNAYVTAASCSPSRAGLLTGRYQQRFGFEFNMGGSVPTHRQHRGLDLTAITMADVLKNAGYVTGIFGKWHLGTREQFHPQSRGFTEFYGFLAGEHSYLPHASKEPVRKTLLRGHTPLAEPEYLTDAIAREAVNFIAAHHGERFFAYVSFNAVHTPIQAPKKYQERFPDVTDAKRRDYYAMTSALDDAIGAMVAALAEHGLTNDTLVIFLNDNGGPLYTGVQSNAPLRMGKLFLFEGGVRVPMIMKWPGVVTPGSVFAGVTSSLDIFPTVCAAAGIKVPKEVELDGVDLVPFLLGKVEGSPHETLFWSNGPNMAVRKGDWKLIKSHDNVWLFDLSRDIGEKNNLAKNRPEMVKELEQELQQWKSQMAKPAWPSSPDPSKVLIDGMNYEVNT